MTMPLFARAQFLHQVHPWQCCVAAAKKAPVMDVMGLIS